MIPLIFLPFASAGDTKGVGSADTLVGEIHTWMIFVSDGDSDWTWKEQREMKTLVKRGQHWISSEAEKFQITNLHFVNHRRGVLRDLHLETLPEGTRSGDENVQMVGTILPQIGFNSPQEFLQRHQQQQQLLIFLKRDGASYAIPQEHNLSPRYDLEGMVIYYQFDEQTPQCASCIAHEILHVFGAWDFYPTFQTTEEQYELAKTQFPNSPMLRTSYNEWELEIDPVTCWRIGWCSQVPENALFFTPNKLN